VSCTCCAAPSDCCMYPAQALFDGLYTVDDLPDTVVITYTEAQSPFTTFGPYVLTRTGSNFFGGPDNEVGIGLSTTGELWTIEDGSGGIGSFPCLINEESPGSPFVVTIEDQFADTYTVTVVYGPPGNNTNNFTISRISLCEWEGSDGINPETWKLFYATPQNIFANPSFYYKFYLDQSVSRIKLGFMNTPEGTYDPTGDSEISVTVS
jgi:hypothetical protein